VLFIPVPSADHDVPFHRAMRFAVTPPAVVNTPPAIRSPLGSTARAYTVSFIPVPSADHDVPFHRAMQFAVTPPAVVKKPPAIRSPLGSSARAVDPFVHPRPQR
jgi:hypothetical protein